MKKYWKPGVTGGVLALCAMAAMWTMAPRLAHAEPDAFNDTQVKAIQKIIKDYLVENPEVLLEAQEAYEKKLEAKRAEAQGSRMPEFYKAIDGLKAELAPYSVGNGDVTMVEFFDYNCGYCQRTLPEVLKLLDTDKKVKVVFLEFPILSQGSQEASKVAVAAAKQGKYFEFHKAMLSLGHASKDTALKVAQQVGLDMNKVKDDMAAPETGAFIAKINELARRIYIDGTPSFIVGDKLNPGAADAKQLEELLQETRKNGCKACVTDASAKGGAGAKDEKKS